MLLQSTIQSTIRVALDGYAGDDPLTGGCGPLPDGGVLHRTTRDMDTREIAAVENTQALVRIEV